MIDVTKLEVFKDKEVSLWYPEDGPSYFSFKVHGEMVYVELGEKTCKVNGHIIFDKFEDIPIKELLKLPEIYLMDEVVEMFKLEDIDQSNAHSLYLWRCGDVEIHVRHKYFDSIKVYTSDNKCFYSPNELSLSINMMLMNHGGVLSY